MKLRTIGISMMVATLLTPLAATAATRLTRVTPAPGTVTLPSVVKTFVPQVTPTPAPTKKPSRPILTKAPETPTPEPAKKPSRPILTKAPETPTPKPTRPPAVSATNGARPTVNTSTTKPTRQPATTTQTTKLPSVAVTPQITSAPEAVKTNRPIATKAPSITRVTAAPKPTVKTASSSSARGYEAEYGTVEVFTTSGKVNMRSGPGKGNKVVTQVEKRGTSLGQLLDAKADNKGVVWFKAKYKGKTGWITSDYANAVAGTPDGSVRLVEGKATELSHLYLRSISEGMDLLELDEDYRSEDYDMGGSNDVVYIAGGQYTEFIQLDGEGYTVYGVKIGDKIRDAQKKFQKASLVLRGEDAEGYIYSIICSPDSLFIDEYGFDGVMAVTVNSDNKVESILLQANSIQ